MSKKRAQKKTAKKRSAQRRKTPPQRTPWLRRFVILILLIALAVSGVYYVGSFETRARMELTAVATLNSARTHGSMPTPIARLFDIPYDWIPSSEGMVVEGGELGRDPKSPFLVGMPQSRQPIRPLLQPSYVNLFNEQNLQTACIALRLVDGAQQQADARDAPQVDARVPRLTAQAMTLGEWQPEPIAPAAALIRQYGARGASDAALATNYAPMRANFSAGPWQKAMHQLTQRYPARFGEVWLYLGPVYRPESAKLASGIAIPDAFYAIALDLTDAGGLRALALLIPTDAESRNLNDYLSSIAQIEQLTGLQFLPELDFSIRDTLIHYVSPSIW